MARTVAEIEQRIYNNMTGKPSLALLLSNPSQVAIWKDIVHSFAVEIATLEQLQDEFRVDTEETLSSAALHTKEFLREQAFYFQYDAATPQVITWTNFVASYSIVDETKRIVSLCVIRFNTSRVLDIFVAKSSPPVKLTVGEVAALQAYLTDGGGSAADSDGVGVAGIAHAVHSLDPDYVWLEGEVFFDGQYSSTIEADVFAAIEGYFADLGRDGILNITKLVDAVQSVTGVEDFVIENLAYRANGDLFSAKVLIIDAFELQDRQADTHAGYAYSEVEPGETLQDKLTFTAA